MSWTVQRVLQGQGPRQTIVAGLKCGALSREGLSQSSGPVRVEKRKVNRKVRKRKRKEGKTKAILDKPFQEIINCNFSFKSLTSFEIIPK